MNVDINIYMMQFRRFFDENPGELEKLIGNSTADVFFEEVKKVVNQNYENDTELNLTRQQIIDIVLKINNKKQREGVFIRGPITEICLN
jgi:hypothetical protein